MNFTATRKELLSAIAQAMKVVSSKVSLPILTGLLIKTANDHVCITGNDLEIAIEAKAKATVETEGSIVLNAKLFSEIVRLLPEADINVRLLINGEVLITCCMSEFKLKSIPADGYPDIQKIKADTEIELCASILKTTFSRTLFAVCKDENRPILTGVLLDVTSDSVNVVAIDGYRCAYASHQMKNSVNARAIIPASTVANIMKILPDEGQVKIGLKNNVAEFSMDNVVMVSRLLEGEFMDYTKLFPEKYNTRISVSKAAFMGCVERVNAINTSSKNPLKITVSNDGMQCDTKTETGTCKENIKLLKKAGEDIEIKFNPYYLFEGLRALPEDNVLMGFNGPMNAAVMTATDYGYLILPIRPAKEDHVEKAA